MKKWIIWIHVTAFCGLILFIQFIFLLLLAFGVVVLSSKAEKIKKIAREFRSVKEEEEKKTQTKDKEKRTFVLIYEYKLFNSIFFSL